MTKLMLDWNGAMEMVKCRTYLDMTLIDAGQAFADEKLQSKLDKVFDINYKNNRSLIRPADCFPIISTAVCDKDVYLAYKMIMKNLVKAGITKEEFNLVEETWNKFRNSTIVAELARFYDAIKNYRHVEDGPIPM